MNNTQRYVLGRQLCAAAARSASSWLPASSSQMSQGQLKMSCQVSLQHPHPAGSRSSGHREHFGGQKGSFCPTHGSWEPRGTRPRLEWGGWEELLGKNHPLAAVSSRGSVGPNGTERYHVPIVSIASGSS